MHSPEEKISDLSCLVEKERQNVLYKWNDTAVKYPKNNCVHELFEVQVAKTPDAVAVRFKEQYLTYAELNKRANQLARYLQRLGVGPEVVVGICLERSPEMIVALLAILKSGGAYVPLDIKFPKDRLGYILDDAQINFLLTEEWLEDQLPEHQAQVVYLNEVQKTISSESAENLPKLTTSENLMYILFTSGSTGRPKGVEILHRSVVNFLTTMAQQPGMTDKDVILSITTLSFDIAVLEIYLPLIVGAQFVIASSEVTANGAKLLELLNSSDATIMQATPATWRLLLSAGWTGSKHLKILCGGEALPKILATQLLKRCKELWNLYGPTETTVWSTAYLVKDETKSAIVGRPIANTQIYILNQNLEPTPIEVPGELFIGGDGLARGYLHRVDLTTEKFIPNPYSKNPEAKMYRTGDLARFLADGTIEFLGRIDHQVKIRGFRIELGEIETVLSQHSVIREAVVVPQEYDSGDKRLVAYIVPQQKLQLPTSKELYKYLKGKLPDYMVPSAFVFLDALPLTPNNKLDRRALPKPDKSNLNLEERYLAPQNDLEIKLVNIWEKVLGIKPIGIMDDFFSLGGNSLLAASLVAEIQNIFGITLSPAIFFETPTIERLASILSQENKTFSSAIQIKKSGTKSPLFLIGNSFLYQQMISFLEADRPVYVIQETLGEAVEMASRCIKAIKSIQPNGTYHLLGHSYEGLVAYEVAQQLYAENKKVDFLGLIDTPTPEVEMRVYNGSYLHNKLQKFKIILRFNWQEKLNFFRERIQYGFTKNLQENLLLREKFLREYVPQTYSGKLTLFAATFEFYVLKDSKLGWSELVADGVQIYQIPSSHRSILLEPKKAQLLAENLTNCLK